jgi:putative FmdB family regulatory protein
MDQPTSRATIPAREMPIYEYQCRHCANKFEMLVLRSTIVACPLCQTQEPEQLLSTFALSSEGIRQANAQTARRAAVNSTDYRDQKNAEADYARKHLD